MATTSDSGPDTGGTTGRGFSYESLYRSAPELAEGQADTRGPRPYEPTLRPPEGASDFGWLFRETVPAEDAALGDQGSPPPEPPAGPAVPPAVEPPPPARRPRLTRGKAVVLAVVILLVAVGAGIGLGFLVRGQGQGGSQPTTDPPSASGPSAWTGAVNRARPVSASVDCVAPAEKDAAGRPVTYEPQLMLDGNLSTAWRCPGDGVGRTVILSFSSAVSIGEVGLVNGYAKVDPASGVQRYNQYRRISAVTWIFPDGRSFGQQLSDGTQTMQSMRIPVEQASEVRLRIDSTTMPGVDSGTFDAVLISELAVGVTS